MTAQDVTNAITSYTTNAQGTPDVVTLEFGSPFTVHVVDSNNTGTTEPVSDGVTFECYVLAKKFALNPIRGSSQNVSYSASEVVKNDLIAGPTWDSTLKGYQLKADVARVNAALKELSSGNTLQMEVRLRASYGNKQCNIKVNTGKSDIFGEISSVKSAIYAGADGTKGKNSTVQFQGFPALDADNKTITCTIKDFSLLSTTEAKQTALNDYLATIATPTSSNFSAYATKSIDVNGYSSGYSSDLVDKVEWKVDETNYKVELIVTLKTALKASESCDFAIFETINGCSPKPVCANSVTGV